MYILQKEFYTSVRQCILYYGVSTTSSKATITQLKVWHALCQITRFYLANSAPFVDFSPTIQALRGSNPPTANFFRLLCSVHLPQKVRGIFTLKTQKLASERYCRPFRSRFSLMLQYYGLFQPQKQENCLIYPVDKSGNLFGGEEGIRTLDTLMGYTRFPIVRARPTTRLLRVCSSEHAIQLSAWLL